ncbi:MAG: RNase adapter RapZ [Rickettsiales bacterium]|nr:RNase adapter RapZ [Rickettsiales bacterium]
MKLILVTGMSGAGKSLALKTLEDCGFEAIDNLPLSFLPTLVGSGAGESNLVVGSDIRGRDFSARRFRDTIEALRAKKGLTFTLLFLDSDDEVLRRRYTETRRRHPLAQDRPVMDGIQHERMLLAPVRELADVLIDTSEYEAAGFRQIIGSQFAGEERHLSLIVTSFSFKQGLPRDADMVFDVRFLRNPHYDPELKALTGLDARVGAYVEEDAGFSDFYGRLTGLLTPLLPRYLAEGKSYLTIGIGCTGGRHRSVHVAQKLGAFLENNGYTVTLRHRDIASH